jgi:hypothetical protein
MKDAIMAISQELQHKIDALPDEKLKANIIQVLSSPGKKAIANEQIFENMVARHARVILERAKWRQWHDDEVIAFFEHFRQTMPYDHAEFIKQEREQNEIEDELWWRVGQLADQWMPDLDFEERSDLLGKVRDHVRNQLVAQDGQP